MTIAVAGATGLIGRHVVEVLAGQGTEPVIATHRSRPPFAAAGVRWVQCDFNDRAQASQAIAGCDSVVLCAGRVSTSAVLRDEPVESVLDNLRIVTNAMEAAARGETKRIVLVSSCTGYPPSLEVLNEERYETGDPPGHWFGVGWMHRYLEKQLEWYVRTLGWLESGVVLRPTLVYGPHDDFDPRTGHFLPSLVRRVVERSSPIRLAGDGNQTRNLIHARDLAGAVKAVLRSEPGFEAFNVATPDEVSVRSILQALLAADGFRDAVVELEGQNLGPAMLRVSGSRFMQATGWRPATSIHQGLEELLVWYRANRHVE
ncbi:NAD-dependent epimerase/dehydratase family protein [Reyranella sp.]|uniref:NAD-dependent epimerase/dehydratase family protein n=1 Tax=Reyranella sp. TaxID=1929291 RepID=UPI003BAD56BA